MQIEHNPNEPPVDREPGPWRWVIPIIAVLWVGAFFAPWFNWLSVALGLMTGVVVTAWVIEITGNKVPESWRKGASGAGRR
jgi:hypothetical protein